MYKLTVKTTSPPELSSSGAKVMDGDVSVEQRLALSTCRCLMFHFDNVLLQPAFRAHVLFPSADGTPAIC